MKTRKLLIALTALGLAWAGIARADDQPSKPTIVLVHGAWADFSSWDGVVDLLLKDGYNVRAVPNTLRGLAADAAVVATYLKSVAGPVVLAGHSYGGSVISVASANAPNVKALVYVDAFAPDAANPSSQSSRALRRRHRISRLQYPSPRPTGVTPTCTSTPNTSGRCLHLPNLRMSPRGWPLRSARSRHAA